MEHTTYDKHLVSLTAPGSFAAEQYQALRLKIERLRQAREVRAIAITSPGASDGKTVTSINLAAALSRGTGSRVLLIDADLRRPAIADELHLDAGAKGLADLAATESLPLNDAVQRIESSMDVITAGQPVGPVHEIFHSPRMMQLVDEARASYDFVILDTPPLVPVVDAALLARMVDGVLLVVAANKTPRKLLEEALNQLDAPKVLGIVFNNDSRPLYGYYNNGYRRYFSRNRFANAAAL
jgi:capsular exopolysaccharide synthesis family protein